MHILPFVLDGVIFGAPDVFAYFNFPCAPCLMEISPAAVGSCPCHLCLLYQMPYAITLRKYFVRINNCQFSCCCISCFWLLLLALC